MERKRKVLQAQIAALQLDLETEAEEVAQFSAHEAGRLKKVQQDRSDMVKSRSPSDTPGERSGRPGNGRGGRK